MLRLVSDENFKGSITRGILLRQPTLDLVRVQDIGLSGTDDPIILQWAAQESRLVLTHDVRTMPKFATERILSRERMPGLIIAARRASVGAIIDDILLITTCSLEDEWENRILYIPL